MPSKVDLFNHSLGVQTNVSPFLMKEGASPDARNVEFHSQLGGFSKTGGYAQYGSDPGNSKIQGLFAFEMPSGLSKLFMVSNGVLYDDQNGTWTQVHTEFSPTGKPEATRLYNFLYVVQGEGGNNFRTQDGQFWSDAQVSSTKKARYVEAYRNRVYYIATQDGLNYFSASDVGDGTSIDFTNSDIEDPITGAETAFNYLYIFTDKNFHRFDESYLVKVDNVGCVSNRSIASGDGLMFWANRDGVYASTGGKPQLISRPVQYWYDGIPPASWTDLNGTFFDHEYYLWIGDSNGIDDVVIVYNTLHKTWRVMTGWPSAVMAVWTRDNGNKNLYFGNNTANSLVYKVGDVLSQTGSAATAQYDYAPISPAGPDKEFYGTSLYCFAKSKGLATFQIQYATEWDKTFFTLDEWTLKGNDSIETYKIDVPKAIYGGAVQWRVVEATTNIPWTWYGMRFYFEKSPGSGE